MDNISNLDNLEHLAKIHSFETFGTVDGPGVRFVIFFWGCLLRCLYCHNPDTWGSTNYHYYSKEALLKEILKYQRFFGQDGGITLSGGEPLKHYNFLSTFLPLVKKEGINITIDTCGAIHNEVVKDLIKDYTDLVLLDIKAFYPSVYKQVTGYELEPTLLLLKYLKEINKKTWIRYVLVPNLTDNMKMITDMRNFLMDYQDIIDKIEILPFHKMGEFKWESLRFPYKLKDTPSPTTESLNKVKELFTSVGFSCQ